MVSTLQIVLLVAFFAGLVVSYSVVPEGQDMDLLDTVDDRDLRFMDELRDSEIRLKRNTVYYGPFSKRNSLKRLVILSARGFGKRR